MRLWVFSDLHTDVCEWVPPEPRPAHDVVVIAGDVGEKLVDRVLPWVERHFGGAAPVVYVPGNHDFWKENLTIQKAKARTLAAEKGIHLLLDGDTAVLGGVRFVGGTLWTDYAIRPELRRAAEEASKSQMRDHKRIRLGEQYKKWWTGNAIREHVDTLSRIRTALEVPHDGPTVVVTHHPPHEKSLQHGEWREPIDGAYASDLSEIMEGTYAPDVWIHGHVHVNRDYVVGGTRVVANPRGYVMHHRKHRGLDARTEVENPGFDENFTLTI